MNGPRPWKHCLIRVPSSRHRQQDWGRKNWTTRRSNEPIGKTYHGHVCECCGCQLNRVIATAIDLDNRVSIVQFAVGTNRGRARKFLAGVRFGEKLSR